MMYRISSECSGGISFLPFLGNDHKTSCADSSCQVEREGTTQHVCGAQ